MYFTYIYPTYTTLETRDYYYYTHLTDAKTKSEEFAGFGDMVYVS